MTKTVKLIARVALMLFLGITVSARPAMAGTPPSIVEYLPNKLLVQQSGTNFMGVTSAPTGCTANNQSIDTLKAWQSLAQAALLSGKGMNIYSTVCGGTTFITGIDLGP